MRRPWIHKLVWLLLLLLAVDAGATLAAGLTACDGCCGCCPQLRHGAPMPSDGVHAATPHPMGLPVQRVAGDGADTGCCRPTMSADCDDHASTALALVPTALRLEVMTGQSPRQSAGAVTRLPFSEAGQASSDPFTATLLSRSLPPIYLRTAVFLC